LEVRDHVLRIGAKAVETAVNGRKRRATEYYYAYSGPFAADEVFEEDAHLPQFPACSLDVRFAGRGKAVLAVANVFGGLRDQGGGEDTLMPPTLHQRRHRHGDFAHRQVRIFSPSARSALSDF
jgi:hypothetical protein